MISLSKKLAAILILALLIAGCKGDDEGNISPRTVFKLNVKADAAFYSNAVWVSVMNSETGELIEYKRLTPGLVVTVDTDKPLTNDLVDVAFLLEYLFAHDGVTDKTYSAEVYTQVKAGAEWTMSTPSGPAPDFPEYTGTYKLQVTGVPHLFSLSLSDKYGPLDGYSIPSGSVSGTINLRPNAPTQILSIDDGETPRYKLLENLKSGDNISFSISSMNTFDKVVELKLPKPSAPGINVVAYDDYSTSGYPLYDNTFFSEFFVNGAYDVKRTSVKIPFLNRFSNYYINIVNGDFLYRSMGPAPAAIEYIDPSVITITNKSITSFGFSSSRNVLRRRTSFAYYAPFGPAARTSVIVNYHSGAELVKFNQPFPDELVSLLTLPVNKLEYSQSYYVINGDKYSDYVNRGKAVDGQSFYMPPPFVETVVVNHSEL